MARSKSWAESQQAENQYTYGQYWFNVMAMLLIALALIALLVYVLWPQPQASTKVFLIRPDAGSEIRSIPFQENDFEGLKNTFKEDEVVKLDDFNDKDSFDQFSVNLKDKLDGAGPTTAIVICSAIGAVEKEGNPILRPTTSRGKNIEVKEFLKKFVSAIDCQRYVVILDCGHDYSKSREYFENSEFQQGDDFNKFTTAVEELVNSKDLTEKSLAVITANGDGEVPLYSYNKRRTLFGLALQDALASPHANVDELCKSLVGYCHLHGGDAAQTPEVFKSLKFDEGELEIAGLSVRSKKQEPDVPVQDGATTKGLKQIADFWRDRDEVESKFATAEETLLLPADFETAWETAIKLIVEKTADLRNGKRLTRGDIGDFEEPTVLREARKITNKFPGLFTSIEFANNSASQSKSSKVDPRARRDIAKAFVVHHRGKLKARYHMAIFESLSWLDNSTSLKNYEEAINELISPSVLSNPLFDDAVAEENELDAYRKAHLDISDKIIVVDSQLKKLCEYLGGDDKYGFTREMALMCLLDSPLIESGNLDPDAVRDDHKRDGLMDALEREGFDSGRRLTVDIRKANSERRNKIFAKLKELCSPPSEPEFESRKHDSIAYYMNVGRSKLLDLKVNPKPIVYNLALKNRDELESKKQLIEREETKIALRLIATANSKPFDTKFNLVCELPPNAPFKILNGTQEGNLVRINNSDGKILIKAIKNADDGGAGSDHFLTVKSDDGKKFANKVKPIVIPLALPGEDRIELVLAMLGDESGNATRPIPGFPSTLRPLPNRKESFEMSLVNHYHRSRTVKATLYACKSIEGIMPGIIDEEVKEKTRVGIGQLPVIAVSVPVDLKEGKLREPVKINWSAEPEPDSKTKMMGPGDSAIQGLLCRVVELAEEGENVATPKDFWIPVFPEDGDLFTRNLRLVRATGEVKLDYVKSELGKNKAIELVCSLSDEVLGRSKIPKGEDTGSQVIISNWDKVKSENDLLHIGVDGWPRRYSFIVENGQFLDALSNESRETPFPNIEFDVDRRKTNTKSFELKDVASDDPKVRQAWGYSSKEGERTVEGDLKITCDMHNHFQFPDSRDSVKVKFGNDLQKFFYPRDVKSFVSLDPDNPARLNLKSEVTDFSKSLKVENDYEIDPIAIQTDLPSSMTGRDITRIIFDNQPPKPPRFQIKSGKIYPKKWVEIINLSPPVDARGGVGVDQDIKKAFQATVYKDGAEVKLPWKGSSGGFRFEVKEIGSYRLSCSFIDRLGNDSKSTFKSFRVDPVPLKPKEPPKKKVVKKLPKPVTHVLKVTVFVGSARLQAGQKPDLTISPDDGINMQRTGGDTFEFTGLKPDVEYSVAGEYKLTTGFGVETKGETKPWKALKDQRETTKLLTLRLEQ